MFRYRTLFSCEKWSTISKDEQDIRHPLTDKIDLLYLTGLLNSKVLDWFLKRVTTDFRGGYFAANKQFLSQLPIRTIDFDDTADVAQHERMVALVERMLDLHRRQSAAATPQERSVVQRQIAATDVEIDALVYALYGLTEAEIAIVEGRGSSA